MAYNKLWSDEVEQRLREAGKNLDPQKPPKEPRMCTKCVMTSARPRIKFDENGVCSACNYALEKVTTIDWAKREEELKSLLDFHHKPSGYDVIVPASGGKDSASVALRLKNDYGMNPLCVSWAPFVMTDIGRKNFDAFVHSGFDIVTASPNGLLHRKLSRLALEFYGDNFIPFIYGQLCFPMNIAAAHDIPLVFFGENGEAEYGGDPSANHKASWDHTDWERVYMKGASLDRLINLGKSVDAFTDKEVRQLSPFYRLPEGIEEKTAFHWFGYYKFWHPQENYYVAAENTGFEANSERSEGTYSKYASLDDKLDGLHYWFGYLKFGIGRATSDAAHEIRDGDIERSEALALVEKYDGEFPAKHFRESLDYLGLTEEHFEVIADRFNSAGVDWRKKRLEAHV